MGSIADRIRFPRCWQCPGAGVELTDVDTCETCAARNRQAREQERRAAHMRRTDIERLARERLELELSGVQYLDDIRRAIRFRRSALHFKGGDE